MPPDEGSPLQRLLEQGLCPAPQTWTNSVPCYLSKETMAIQKKDNRDIVNSLKTLLRQCPVLYDFLIMVISPSFHSGLSPHAFVRRFSRSDILINLGSGTRCLGGQVINVDVFPFKNVDILADAAALPFVENSVDGVICEFLLEHVRDPEQVVSEIFRVLRPGGCAYIAVPFLYPFHSSPSDFYRWSREGVRILLQDFTIEELRVRSGPTSALTAQLVTWCAIVLSLGVPLLYIFWSNFLLLVFFPLKILDVLMSHFTTANHGVATWSVVVNKRRNNMEVKGDSRL